MTEELLEEKESLDPEKVLSPHSVTLIVERGGTCIQVPNLPGKELPITIMALHALLDAVMEQDEGPGPAVGEVGAGHPIPIDMSEWEVEGKWKPAKVWKRPVLGYKRNPSDSQRNPV
jgi:hypothetical protein